MKFRTPEGKILTLAVNREATALAAEDGHFELWDEDVLTKVENDIENEPEFKVGDKVSVEFVISDVHMYSTDNCIRVMPTGCDNESDWNLINKKYLKKL